MEPMFPKEMTHSAMGKKKTQSLFVETARQGDEPFLSLRPQKNNGAVSLRDLFIQYVVEDPSESVFAETVFGDYDFWLNLLECKWMEEHVLKWRKVTDAKRKALAFKAILEEVQTNGKSAFSAAKYLVEEPWKGRTKETKAKVKESAEEGFSFVSEDFKRLKEQGLIQ